MGRGGFNNFKNSLSKTPHLKTSNDQTYTRDQPCFIPSTSKETVIVVVVYVGMVVSVGLAGITTMSVSMATLLLKSKPV